MQHAEDGGVGANPERQRQHGRQRDARTAKEVAEAEAEIGEHGGH